MLKLVIGSNLLIPQVPAAFGRLCVETSSKVAAKIEATPAAFGRLCVETIQFDQHRFSLAQPPSGGCVLKQVKFGRVGFFLPSRLRAAAC